MGSQSIDVEKRDQQAASSDADSRRVTLERTRTHHKQHAETVGARVAAEVPSYGMNIGGGRPFPPGLPASDEYLVDFEDAHDPLHPQNWTMVRKYVTFPASRMTVLLIMLC